MTLITALAAAAIWFGIGIAWTRRHEDGWLIMITDRRNVRATWMALPALLVTWTLWPACNAVARRMFLIARML